LLYEPWGNVFTGFFNAISKGKQEKRRELARSLFCRAVIDEASGLIAGGRILFVDEEETICTLGQEMLEYLGFDVIIARDDGEAVQIYRSRHDEIVCIILDLTMPGMDVEEVFREVRYIDPGVAVLKSSEYNQQEVNQRFAGNEFTGFIQKAC